MTNPLFKDGPRSFEAIAENLATARSDIPRSPLNGKLMQEFKCGDIPVLADLDSRVVYPKPLT